MLFFKKTALLLVIIVLPILFFGSFYSEASQHKILRIGATAEAPTLDPRLVTDEPAAQRMHVIFDALVLLDWDLSIAPKLAREFEVTDDGLQLTFFLREDVKWHHGRQFVAEDVKYTFDWILNPDNAAPNRALYLAIQNIEIINDFEVIFHLSEPQPFLLNNIARMPVVPKDVAEERGSAFATNPVGTGAFIFKEWVRDDKMILVANEDYYLGRPKVDEIHFHPISEDTTRLLSLEARELDLIIQFPVEDLTYIEEDPNLILNRSPGTGYYHFTIDMEREPLKNKKVRHALAHLVDRESIVEYVRRGLGEPAYNMMTPALAWHNEDVPRYDYDPEKARQLLEEAGYGDGFSIKLVVDEDEGRVEICEIFQSEAAKLGIDVEIQVYEWGTFLDIAYNRAEPWDMFLCWWTGQVDPDRATYRQFHSEGPFNSQLYHNPRVDELLELGRREYDHDTSIALYREAQELIVEDCSYIFIYYEERYGASLPNVVNWRLHPYGGGHFFNSHLIDIKN